MYLDLISFYYIFECYEKTKKKNENWNVLCIKAQFQMDYYLFNTTRKKRFYDSIHEFCELSSPANLKFHTDHKNIEKSKKMRMWIVCFEHHNWFRDKLLWKILLLLYYTFSCVSMWLNIYIQIQSAIKIYFDSLYFSQLLILFMHKHNFMYLYERVLNITNISQ